MTSYALWNNKGGVGKSFLCFVASCEYAQTHPETDVYVIDLCPQGNVSETLLGGQQSGSKISQNLRVNPHDLLLRGIWSLDFRPHFNH